MHYSSWTLDHGETNDGIPHRTSASCANNLRQRPQDPQERNRPGRKASVAQEALEGESEGCASLNSFNSRIHSQLRRQDFLFAGSDQPAA
jgi:hypothetical protein